MQLSGAEPLGMPNQHCIRARYVETRLYYVGGEEDVTDTLAERHDRLIHLGGRQLAMDQHSSELGGDLSQTARDRLQVFDTRTDKKTLTAAALLVKEHVPDQSRLEWHDGCADRQASRWRRLQCAQCL